MQLLSTDGNVREGNYSDTSYTDVKAVVTPAIDLVFHLQRLEGVYQGILSGEFPVRIDPGWLGLLWRRHINFICIW